MQKWYTTDVVDNTVTAEPPVSKESSTIIKEEDNVRVYYDIKDMFGIENREW